jgi:hypothetical protein
MKKLVVCTLLGCLMIGNSYCLDELIIGQAGQEEGYVTPSDIKQLEQKLEQEITGVKQEMKQEITGVKQEITGVRQKISGLSDLLTQFLASQQNKEENK